jgi:hypothetical protein
MKKVHFKNTRIMSVCGRKMNININGVTMQFVTCKKCIAKLNKKEKK